MSRKFRGKLSPLSRKDRLAKRERNKRRGRPEYIFDNDRKLWLPLLVKKDEVGA